VNKGLRISGFTDFTDFVIAEDGRIILAIAFALCPLPIAYCL
jgi:hypothetical protein